ncbi:TerD family protein [Kitasatospora sp. MBT63]|uniref:TerD family protein n=1 Tax=Kitasatospora sp. MBT63 TaxID=1444768 RepID=UPI0005398FB1|nr:TerD family protein [Kitasatospora sp. MBT63]
MAAELVRGQNLPLPHTAVTIRLTAAGHPAAVVLLGDADGRVPGTGHVAHPGAPVLPGVTVPGGPAERHEVRVDLAALPPGVERLSVALVLPAGAAFTAAAAPRAALAGPDGTDFAVFPLTGLGHETAVIAVELYRRGGTWKVRAVGQGYAEGAEALLRDHGVDRPADLAAALTPAPAVPAGAPAPAATPAPAPVPAGGWSGPLNIAHPRRPAPGATPPPSTPPPATPQPAAAPSATTPPTGPEAPVAGDAPGWTMDERLYNQVWGIFEDAARSAAAYRSAVEYADRRQDQEIENLLADPRSRFGAEAELGRMQARARRDDLESRAREVLDRDSAQLLAELRVVEEALPAPMASWDSAVWAGWTPAAEPPHGVRIGELNLPENPGLRVPMLLRFPLGRGLWVDHGSAPESAGGASADAAERKAAACAVAAATAARLLACHPPGGLLLHVVDPGGGSTSLAPFARAGLLTTPPATDAAGVAALLTALVERVDLMQMARRAGAPEALPPHVDPAARLLLVHDFPYGFDDGTIAKLRYLAEEGPEAGVHLLVVADRAEARAYGPVLDPFWRGLTRMAPVPQEYLADPWVEHLWTYTPVVPEPGGLVLPALLERIAMAGRAAR